MATYKRLAPDARREQILLTALKMAQRSHYMMVTRDQVAKRLGVTPPLISYYFPTRDGLLRGIYEAAVEREIVEVVAQHPSWSRLSSPGLIKKLKKYFDKGLTK